MGFLRLAGLIFSFWLAAKYYQTVANWLADQWGWADTISSLLQPLIKLPGPFNSPEILKLPVGLLQKISSQIPLPSPWPDIIAQLSQIGSNQTVEQAINLVIAQGILKIVAFIGLFAMAKFVIGLVLSLVSVILAFSPFGLGDKVIGILFGLAAGVTIIFLIITVLVPLQIPLALLGSDGLVGLLGKGISNSYLINEFSPLVKELKIIPPLIPEFSSQFLFKSIPTGPGTEI